MRSKSQHGGPFKALGSWVGGAVDRFVGTGDYKIERNTVLKPTTVPAMHSSSTTSIVRHREYICDIKSWTGPALITEYPVNPGIATSFPWLHTIANGFEMYRFLGCVFEYKSLSGDVTVESNQGFVAAAINYNPTGNKFSTKLAIENATGGQSNKPSQSFYIPMECKPQLNPLGEYFVRDAATTVAQNLNFYDVGTLTIGVGGNPTADVVLGELWCTYEIEFSKPAVDELEEQIIGAHLVCPTGCTNSTPIGVQADSSFSFNSIGAWTDALGQKTLIPAPHRYARYWICHQWTGTVAVNTVRPGSTFYNGASESSFWAGGIVPNDNSTLSLTHTAAWCVAITDPAKEFSITWNTNGTLPGGTLTLDVFVFPVLYDPTLVTDRKRIEPVPTPVPTPTSTDDWEEAELLEEIRCRVAALDTKRKSSLASL